MSVTATQIVVKICGAETVDDLHRPVVSAFFDTGDLGGTVISHGIVNNSISIVTNGTYANDDIFCLVNDASSLGNIDITYVDDDSGTSNIIAVTPGHVAVVPGFRATSNISLTVAANTTGEYAIVGS